MPSLSRGQGRDQVAERLLVAEDEPLARALADRAGDPLEAGEGLGVVDTSGVGHAGRAARRTRGWSRPAGRRPRCGGGCGRPAASPARRPSGGATRRPAWGWRRPAGRHPGRWPAPGRHRPRRRQAISRSMAPGSSGLGKDTVGKSGSGANCSATTAGRGQPARSKAASSVSPPTPCIGVYATVTSLELRHEAHRGHRGEVGLDGRRRGGTTGGRRRRPPRCRPGRRRRWPPRSRRRPVRRSASRRPGTPCTRCPVAGCGWR